MFTTSAPPPPYFRFNASWAWGEREEQAVRTLARLIREAMAKAPQ
ncbi:Transcriptional regulator, GntR family domain / Aspartate aminotransferase [Cronobacter malonaticus 681]|nr:Transcriptional regulator, GntR family domain / Aspartate aminotransferase [Cronobacter malonaticus 681]